MTLISVDLPDPEGPTMVTNSPAPTDRFDTVEGADGGISAVLLGDAGEFEHAIRRANAACWQLWQRCRSSSGVVHLDCPFTDDHLGAFGDVAGDLDEAVGERAELDADEMRATCRRAPRRRSRLRRGRAPPRRGR